MAYSRMPGAVPARYVKVLIKRDDEGRLYASISGIDAGMHEEGHFYDVPLGLAKGEAQARNSDAPLFVQVSDQDWDAAWGELQWDFIERN